MSDEEFKSWPADAELKPYNFEAEIAKIVKEEIAPETRSFPEYKGMNYKDASMAADHLIRRFGWFQSFERLAALHNIMARQYKAAQHSLPPKE